jgi:hypothetical protein
MRDGGAELRDLGIEEGVRLLLGAVVGAEPAVGGKEVVEPVHHRIDIRAAARERLTKLKAPAMSKAASAAAFGHPQDAEALVVGHQGAGADGIDELGATASCR